MPTLAELKKGIYRAHTAGDYEAAQLMGDMVSSGEYDDDYSVDLGLIREAGLAVPRGTLKGALSVGAGLAGLANTITDNIGLEDLIDYGEENEVIRLANQGKKAIDETMGVGDQYRDRWLVQAGEGFGSIGTFLAAGLMGGIPGAAIAGMGFGASDQMDRVAAARARGVEVSKEKEDYAIGWGGVIGSLEAFVPVRLMKRMRFTGGPSQKKAFLEKVGNATVSGVFEGGQEIVNSLLQDAVQTKLVAYDPEGEVSDGESLWDDFTIGTASGFALDLVSNAFVKKQRSTLTKEAELEREQQFREEEEREAAGWQEAAEQRRIQIEKNIQQRELDRINAEREALTEEERATLEAEQAAALEAQYPFDPLMPYRRKISFKGTRLTPSQKLAAEAGDYANQIAQAATRSAQGFPESGRFDVVEDATPDGPVFRVVHPDTGQQYGQSYVERENAIHLMSNLNDQILRRNVNRTITDSIDETNFQYTPEQVKSVYSMGQRLNNPNRDTVTVAMINEAGGTIGKGYQENLSIDSLHQSQYGVPPYTDKGEKIYKDLSNMTVAQQINLERVKKGLPEANEFSLKEAKEALGDKYNNVFDLLLGVRAPDVDAGPVSDFGSVGAKLAASREAYQSNKETRQELIDILKSKNITSDISSPEIQYIFNKTVNETNIDNMSPSQRAYLSNQIATLPTLSEPAPIPDFTPNPYTLEQYMGALDKVRLTGDGTVENIQEVLEEVQSEKRATLVASAIRKRLIDRGVINEDGSLVETKLLPPPVAKEEVAPVVELEPYAESDVITPDARRFEENFKTGLKRFGLEDVGLRVLSTLRIAPTTKEGKLIYERGEDRRISPGLMGYYNPSVKSIFLSVDRASAILKAQGQEVTPESLEASLTEILDHEMVHAVRGLDLWNKKEWQSLEKLARGKVFPDTGNETFFDNAKRRYPNLSPVGQMEEAVAELVRYGRKDKSLITGKPKSLIRKMFSLFERLSNAIRGTGFTTLDSVFESTLGKLESGEIGARERGQIRTLRATEARQMAVPERGIGREADVIDLEDRRALAREAELPPGEPVPASMVQESRLDAADIAALRKQANIERFGEDYAGAVDTSYRIQHTPRRGSDAETVRLDDLTKSISGTRAGYPEDFYSPKGKRVYSPGARFAGDEFGKANDESYAAIMSSRGKPNKTITMYRAVPKGTTQINEGDFVTLSPTYAEIHASSGYGERGQEAGDVISKQVKVKDVAWAQDDVNEFGYFPEDRDAVAPTDRFGNELPRYLYHNPMARGYNESGGISKYTYAPTKAYEGEKDLHDMVMLSRTPMYGNAAKIDVSKLPGYKKKLIDLKMADGHFSYKGDIPSESITERGVSSAPTNVPLPEISSYRDETVALQEIAARNPEGSPLRRYDETNAKVQDDLADQVENPNAPVFTFQTPNRRYGKLKWLTYQVADKFIGLKIVEDTINRMRLARNLPPLETLDSAYAGEQSIAGKAGNELREFGRDRKQPLAEKIAKFGLSREQVDDFLTMRHAIERNNRIALRDPSRDPESQPGAGKLRTGEVLTNSFVKARMKNLYDMNWNDATQTWSGGDSRAKNLLEIAGDTDKIVNETLDRSVKGELMNRDAAESVRSIFKYYTPLQGKNVEDEIANVLAGEENVGVSGKSYSVKGKEVMGAMGKEGMSYSPLGTLLTNAEKTISRSLNNTEFGKKLVNLVNSNPNEDYWEVYSPGHPRYKRNFSRKYRYIGSDPELMKQTFTTVPPEMSKKDFIETIEFVPDRETGDLIGVKINGVQHYVDIKGDDRLRKALIASDSNSGGRVIQMLGKVNRFLSMVNTQLNPEFIIGNFSRDIQTAIYNIIGEQDMSLGKAKDQKLVKKVLKDVMPSMGVFYKVLRRYNAKDGTFSGDMRGIDPKDLADTKEFLEAGAKADWYYTRPPEEQGKTIDSLIDMANGTFTGNTKKAFKHVFDFVEDANSAVENAVRLATFKASRDSLLDAGVKREEAVAKAADLAKNLTINFNRKGMKGDLLNSLYLFFNASVQGTMNFGRGLFGPNMNPFSPEASRRKQGMVASLTLFSALLADMAEEESEINPETGRTFYSEIPDYIKERNLVIMADPSVTEGRNLSNTYIGKDGKEYAGSQYYYTIPLPYGYNVFSYFGQSLSDIGRGNISVPQVASNLTSALMGSFSPVGISPIPTIGQPFYEISQNESFWGSPIYKDPTMFGGTGPYSALSMRSTAPEFKFLAETANALGVPGIIKAGNKYEPGTLDFSPDMLEHLFEFAGGGAGKFFLRTKNYMGNVIDGEEIELKDTPFVRRVYGETDERESQEDYYDRRGTLDNKENALKNLTGAERLEYRRDNVDHIKMLGMYKATEKQLRKLRKQRKEMERRASMNPAFAKQFAEYEEKVFEMEKKLYNRFNKRYDKVVGRAE